MSPLCSSNAWKKCRKLPSTCGGASPELGMSLMKGGCSMCAPTMRRSLSSASSPGPCNALWYPEKCFLDCCSTTSRLCPKKGVLPVREQQSCVYVQHMTIVSGVQQPEPWH